MTTHSHDGSYLCGGCGAQLFDSGEKYNSGCGWPAFTAPPIDR
jgi:peptide-methionine (R)-S-oxide reductase